MVPCSRLSAGHYADYSGSNRSCLPGNLSRWKQNTSIGSSSLLPAIHKKTDSLHEYMYWEHQNNRAIRWGNWKAIRDEKGKEWELYDVVKDRTERNNLAEQHPEVLTKLVTEWEKWANANFVLPKHPKK